MPSTPILSNGGTNRGLPITFFNEAGDSLHSIVDFEQNVWLASKGEEWVLIGKFKRNWGKSRTSRKTSGVFLLLE